jgi:serine/threonine protein phosphatase PrpC
LKNEDIPGLAMTRAMGDIVACRAGVNGEPEIKEFKTHKEDRIVVIASDGVWEFLSNEDVMQNLNLNRLPRL